MRQPVLIAFCDPAMGGTTIPTAQGAPVLDPIPSRAVEARPVSPETLMCNFSVGGDTSSFSTGVLMVAKKGR